jgi:CBS domain-containing protein
MTFHDSSFPDLAGLRVADAMHQGLISCAPDATLGTLARMMATHRVHAILVRGHGEKELAEGRPALVVTDGDLLRAAADGQVGGQSAQSLATAPPIAVAMTDDLRHAARVLQDHGASHLIVVEPQSGRPIGILSTLDVARALAGFPERHPVH